MSSENISIEEMAKEARNRIYIYINKLLSTCKCLLYVVVFH